MNGEPMRPQPKPVRAGKEPSRLRQVSAKRAAKIAAGEASPGLKRTWMKKGQKTTAYSRRPRESGRMLFYKSLPCDVPRLFLLLFGERLHRPGDHEGGIQAMHLGAHGMSNKCDDNETGPGCRGHHDDIDGRSGRLKRLWWTSLTKDEQAHFRLVMIHRAAARWDILTPVERASWDERATAGRRAA